MPPKPPVFKPSGSVNGRTTRQKCWKSTGRTYRDGGISERSQRRVFVKEQDCEQLTLFPADFLASPLASQESSKGSWMTAISGLRCSALSESLRRVGYSVKTYLESCALPPGTWCRTWSVRDMTSSCLIMKLRLSERRTDGKELRLLPTATATVADHGGPNQRDSSGRPGLQMAAMMWPTPTARDYKDGTAHSCQNVPVNGLLGRALHLLPTPRAQSATGSGPSRKGHSQDLQTVVRLYTTPTAGDANGTSGGNMNRSLRTDVGGQLNPEWVCRMMGFPDGWLDV